MKRAKIRALAAAAFASFQLWEICPVFAEPVELSLAESIAMALAADESIAAAEAGQRAAGFGLSAARRAKGPVLSWRSEAYRIGGDSYESAKEAHSAYGDPHPGNYSPLYMTEDGKTVPGSPETVGSYAYNNTFTNSWNLTVPLYSGGKLEGTIAASRYGLNSADLNAENARQTVRYRVAEAYSNLLHRENLRQVAEDAVSMAKRELGIITVQFEDGYLAKADVLTMAVNVANYEKNLVDAEGNLKVAQGTLASLLGLPQDEDVRATDVFTYEPYEKELADCEAYAILHRPDGLAAEYAVKRYEAQKDSAKSGYRPQISGVAGKSTASNKFWGHERSDTWEVGISFSWNIFDNGVTDANVQQAAAVAEQYRAEADRIRKAIRLEVQNAYIQMRTAEKNIGRTKVAMQQAAESYRIAQVRYDEGEDILLRVTDAQEKLTQAESNYYTALYSYNLYRAALEKAMGVGVSLDAERYVNAVERGESSPKALAAGALYEGGTAASPEDES